MVVGWVEVKLGCDNYYEPDKSPVEKIFFMLFIEAKKYSGSFLFLVESSEITTKVLINV